MKILIDLKDVYYEGIKKERILDTSIQPILMAIKHGVKIPDNATNGDMIKVLFPDEDLKSILRDDFWWNSPYKRGETE